MTSLFGKGIFKFFKLAKLFLEVVAPNGNACANCESNHWSNYLTTAVKASIIFFKGQK